MSFDLIVLAVAAPTTAETVRQLAKQCASRPHPDGELDARIVIFYEALRNEFPDFPPYQERSPWASMPLDTGIDYISMCLSYGPSSYPVLERIVELAEEHDLVIYDPQDGSVRVPSPEYLTPRL